MAMTQILRDAWHYSRRTRKWWLLVILVALMGITWLMDVPALIRAKAPHASSRFDPAIKGDEGVRAPLQMLTNVLNLWARSDVGRMLDDCDRRA